MVSIGMRVVYAKMSPLAIVKTIARKTVEETTRLYHVLVRMVKNGQNAKNLQNVKNHAMADENGGMRFKAVLAMEKYMKEKKQKEIAEGKARKSKNVHAVMILLGHQARKMKKRINSTYLETLIKQKLH